MKVIGLHEAILLGELCSEYDELEDGYFYSTRENIGTTKNVLINARFMKEIMKEKSFSQMGYII